jgi:hypothetical protein
MQGRPGAFRHGFWQWAHIPSRTPSPENLPNRCVNHTDSYGLPTARLPAARARAVAAAATAAPTAAPAAATVPPAATAAATPVAVVVQAHVGAVKGVAELRVVQLPAGIAWGGGVTELRGFVRWARDS